MDSESDYERGLPDSTPHTPVTPLHTISSDILTQRVEEWQRMYQLENIEELTFENAKMQKAIFVVLTIEPYPNVEDLALGTVAGPAVVVVS
jgi:hypothetical protein